MLQKLIENKIVPKVTNCLFVLILMFAISSCKNENKNLDANDVLANENTDLENLDTTININYSSPDAAEKILLKFQPVIGKTYTITNNSNFTSAQSMDTLSTDASAKKYAKMKLKILSIENGITKMEFTVIDASKSIREDTFKLDYSYGKPLADPFADVDRKIEDCMVNSPMIISISSQGVGNDIQGYDKILEKVRAIMKAEAPEEMKNIPDDYIASQIGSPTDNLENFFIAFPDTAVKIGDSWTVTTNSYLQGLPIILNNKYTLADRKNGRVFINFATKVEIDKKQIPAEVLSQMSNMKFDAYIKGTGELEEKTGWPLTMKINQGMSFSDTFQGAKQSSKQTNTGMIRTVE